MPIRTDIDSVKKRQNIKITPSPTLLSRLNLIQFPTPPPFLLCGAGNMGNEGPWSVHKGSSLLLLPPHAFPLLQRGSFPWAAVLQDKSAPVWALCQLWFLQGIATCFTTVPAMGCREISALGQEHLLTLLLLSPQCLQDCFTHFASHC